MTDLIESIRQTLDDHDAQMQILEQRIAVVETQLDNLTAQFNNACLHITEVCLIIAHTLKRGTKKD